MLELCQALIDIADEFVEPALQLIDRVVDLLERAGERAHLGLDLVKTQFEIDRSAAVGRRHRYGCAAR